MAAFSANSRLKIEGSLLQPSHTSSIDLIIYSAIHEGTLRFVQEGECGTFLRIRPFQSFFIAVGPFGLRLPISQPHPRSTFTTFGVVAAVRGTRINIKLLWIA